MTLIGTLIKAYEDQHSPKLVDLFPELAKATPVEATSEIRNATSAISGRMGTDFAAAFFAIGHLFSEAGKEEKAISAYNLAIRIKPDYDINLYESWYSKSARGDYQPNVEVS